MAHKNRLSHLIPALPPVQDQSTLESCSKWPWKHALGNIYHVHNSVGIEIGRGNFLKPIASKCKFHWQDFTVALVFRTVENLILIGKDLIRHCRLLWNSREKV